MRDTSELPVSGIRVFPASSAERERGLIAHVSVRVGVLLVDGVRVVRRRDARLVVVLPHRRDRERRSHPILRVTCNETRARLEACIFAELERLGVLP